MPFSVLKVQLSSRRRPPPLSVADRQSTDAPARADRITPAAGWVSSIPTTYLGSDLDIVVGCRSWRCTLGASEPCSAMAPDILCLGDVIVFRPPVTRTRLGASADVLGLEHYRMMLAGRCPHQERWLPNVWDRPLLPRKEHLAATPKDGHQYPEQPSQGARPQLLHR
jgi:hypothetical protein